MQMLKNYWLIALLFGLTVVGCGDEIRVPDASFGKTLLAGAACSQAGVPTCPGVTAPEFSLFDFQPESDTFEKNRALADYQGKTTVVALLAGW